MNPRNTHLRLEPARRLRLVLAASVTLLACAGTAPVSTEEPLSPSPTPTVAETPESKPKPRAETTRSALSVFPADTNLLLSVNVSELIASPLYREVLEKLLHKELGVQLQRVKTICGIDVMSQIGTLLAAYTYDENLKHREDAQMVAMRGLSRPSIRTCMRALVEKKLALKFAEDGVYNKLETESGAYWQAWLDDLTMVFGTKMTRKQLEQRIRAPTGVQHNVALLRLMDLCDRKATAWGIMQMPILDGSQSIEFHSVYGWMHVASGLDLHIGFQHATPEQARDMMNETITSLDQLIAQAGDLGAFIKPIEVTTRDSEMIVTLSYDKAELERMVKQVSMLLGAY